MLEKKKQRKPMELSRSKKVGDFFLFSCTNCLLDVTLLLNFCIAKKTCSFVFYQYHLCRDQIGLRGKKHLEFFEVFVFFCLSWN